MFKRKWKQNAVVGNDIKTKIFYMFLILRKNSKL